ncbi:MAG: hypothetical protein IKW30_13155 [Lachnospiraceae bacterium]|nr:hypothetical protein [Lachnospiraceae bacterium]
MSFTKRRSKTNKLIVLLGLVTLFLGLVSVIYLGDYYHADTNAIVEFSTDNMIQLQQSADGTLIWEPKQATVGFIFYPGGKVEHTAYVPLMNALSAKGILCVLVEMPFRLAVFDINAAEGIQEKFPQIKSWYIGGHSLGGAMAASYLSKNISSFDGLILLGAYSTEDLSNTELNVLSIYGSEDLVMDREKYEQNKEKLPTSFEEIIINGGCHAYFGMYGEQEGDGNPTIKNDEQIIITAETIAMMIGH